MSKYKLIKMGNHGVVPIYLFLFHLFFLRPRFEHANKKCVKMIVCVFIFYYSSALQHRQEQSKKKVEQQQKKKTM